MYALLKKLSSINDLSFPPTLQRLSRSATASRLAVRAARMSFLICGAGRSGTSLLMGMLDNHDRLEVAFEWQAACLYEEGKFERGPDARDRRIRAFVAECEREAAHHSDKIWGNKITTEQLDGLNDLHQKCPHHRAGVLDAFFNHHLRGVKVVYIIRDGRTCVRSKINRTTQSIEAACRRWNYAVEVLQFLKERHSGNMTLRFEDLVTAPEATLRRICAFLEVEFQPAMLLGTTNSKIPAEYRRVGLDLDRLNLDGIPGEWARHIVPGLRYCGYVD